MSDCDSGPPAEPYRPHYNAVAHKCVHIMYLEVFMAVCNFCAVCFVLLHGARCMSLCARVCVCLVYRSKWCSPCTAFRTAPFAITDAPASHMRMFASLTSKQPRIYNTFTSRWAALCTRFGWTHTCAHVHSHTQTQSCCTAAVKLEASAHARAPTRKWLRITFLC